MEFQGLTFETVVYLLCMITSVVCLVLLGRAYRRTRVPLLLWCGLGFVGFALQNLTVVLDKVLTGPEIDLRPYRAAVHLVALGVLIYGFVWDANQ